MKFTDESLSLVFPTAEYEEKAKEIINEMHEYNSEVNGSGGIEPFLERDDYAGWLKKVISYTDVANIKEGKVPCLTYFYVRNSDGRVVGMINIRLADNELVCTEAGHIGYFIRPTERRKHYASQMLNDALRVCRILRLYRVYVTCDVTNPASAGTIKNCGGVLEEELYSETFKVEIQRYVIDNREEK